MQIKPRVSHDNCFNFIRHLAALMVIYSHHYALSGRPEPTFFGLFSLGTLSVVIFFSISGYLITQSFESSQSTIEYAKKRFFRIFPGLAVCLIFTLYICGGIFGKMGFAEWIISPEPIKTFIRVMLFTGFGVVGVTPHGMNYFTSTYHLKNTMNGSLWTLFFEIFEYVLIASALSLFRNKNMAVLLPFFFAMFLLIFCLKVNITNLLITSVGLLTLPFCGGALLFVNKDKWIGKKTIRWMMFFIPWGLFYLSSLNQINNHIFSPIAICLLTIVIGETLKDRLIKERFDFSYGIYIYAFPVQQIIINEMNIGFFASMLLTVLVAVILGAISWFVIEKPIIDWSRRAKSGFKSFWQQTAG